MIKYLFIGLFIAWLFFASPWSRPRNLKKPSGKPARPAPQAPPQQMVACAHCGVHLPTNDALIGPTTNGDSLYFCSEDHRRAGPRSR